MDQKFFKKVNEWVFGKECNNLSRDPNTKVLIVLESFGWAFINCRFIENVLSFLLFYFPFLSLDFLDIDIEDDLFQRVL